MEQVAEHTAYLGLGSNMGDRGNYLTQARDLLKSSEEVRISKESSLYESEPVGYLDQPCFLNQVVDVKTTLAPQDLLHILQQVENVLGRRRVIRWGPRVIDIDLLLYDRLTISSDDLTVPHPRLDERNFVLVPLNEISPELVHPDGRTTAEHLECYLAGKPVEKIKLWYN
jgi:2-amino-4-hydroxy-6-hydroxymethyldihydropteridine diphosphokinase